jgi:hypothetical protein
MGTVLKKIRTVPGIFRKFKLPEPKVYYLYLKNRGVPVISKNASFILT